MLVSSWCLILSLLFEHTELPIHCSHKQNSGGDRWHAHLPTYTHIVSIEMEEKEARRISGSLYAQKSLRTVKYSSVSHRSFVSSLLECFHKHSLFSQSFLPSIFPFFLPTFPFFCFFWFWEKRFLG